MGGGPQTGEGGDQADGPATLDALYRSLVDDAQLIFLALQPDGTVAFASRAASSVLGLGPAQLVGTSILDRLHPDDLERAVVQITTSATAGVTRGITRFRVRHADGSWVPIEIWANPVSDSHGEYLGIYARDGSHQVFLEEVMLMLLRGEARGDALAPVCDTIQWHGAGSYVAIDWIDATGHHQVGTGLPPPLGGAAMEGTSNADADPWTRCRNTGEGLTGAADDLDEQRAGLAAGVQAERYWIEPVRWADDQPPATITVWTGGGRDPSIHAYGMQVARTITELILRWTEHVQELDRAARLDPLTGLANRRAFVAALEQGGGGGVLYCDLDRFKPVNDELGHGAGDELLRLVARRLEECVRDSDLVARMGGDEFAVLCRGATEAEAAEVARRIQDSLTRPFVVARRPVTVGISVGVAHDATHLDLAVLDLADRALGADKAQRRR